MPDVTPNFTGQSSNMRNSTNQSLQQAAMGVQQGGAEMTQIIGQLAQSLAQSNAMVMQSAQKMAKSAQTDRQSLMNAVGQTMEKMGQQINTAAQRRADRSADLKDAQTLQKSGRELADQSQVAAEVRAQAQTDKDKKDMAERAKWEATITKNFREQENKSLNYARLRLNYNNTWAQAVGTEGTPKDVTDFLRYIGQDLSELDGVWEGASSEVLARGQIWGAEMAERQAARNLGQETGSTPELQASLPSGIQLKEQTREAMRAIEQSKANAAMKGIVGPPEQIETPPAKTFTFGELGAFMDHLAKDSIMAGYTSETNRLRAERMLTEDAMKVADDDQKQVAEAKKFSDIQYPVHDKAARSAVITSMDDPMNWTNTVGDDGKPFKDFNPKGLIKNYLQRSSPDDPKVAQQYLDILEGKPLPLSPEARTIMNHFEVTMQNFGKVMGPILEDFGKDEGIQKTLKKLGYVKTTEQGLRLQENLAHAVTISSDTDKILQAQPVYNRYKSIKLATEARLKRGAKYPITAAEISGQSLDETEAKYGPPPRPGFAAYQMEEWAANGEGWKTDIVKRILGKGESSPANALADRLGIPPVPIRPLSRPNQPAGPRPPQAPQAQGLGMAAQQAGQPPQQPVQPGQPPMAPPEEEPLGPTPPGGT